MIKVILTDIEGTTSSISFVVDVLFPYSRDRIKAFVLQHASDEEVARQIDDVRRIADLPGASVEEVGDVLLSWIAEDRKLTPLKALQGMIWAQGYADGVLQGHVYDDVPVALREWKGNGMRLAVYSSGSVAAQRLIFGHTASGDLTPLFSGYFDTTVGGKRESASYVTIAEQLGVKPSEILFLSDIVQELDAARSAGLHTCGLERGARGVVGDHPAATSFSGIHPDAFH